MGAGIFLMALGAVLAFAIRQDDSATVDLNIVGLVLMAAGLAVVWHAHNGRSRQRVVTTIDDTTDPARPTHTVIESVTDRDSGVEVADGHEAERPSG